MSHVTGAVKFADGDVWYYEYDGTSDVVLHAMYKTVQEVSDNWRTWPDVHCIDKSHLEPVEIYSDYGGGFYLKGKACRKCAYVEAELDEDGWSFHEYEPEVDWATPIFKNEFRTGKL